MQAAAAEIVVRASPAKGALALGGAAAADALLAAALIVATDIDVTLALFLGFFGLFAMLGLWLLMAPARLTLSADGLTERVLGRTRRFGWGEVYDFRPASIGLTSRAVGFSFTDANRARSLGRRLNVALCGAEASLNSGWTEGPAELAAMLNAGRERWLARQTGAVAAAARAPTPLHEGEAGARMSRLVYAGVWALVLALAGGLTLIPAAAFPAWIVAGLIGVRLHAARLHDLGLAGGWQLALYAAQGVAVAAAMGLKASTPEIAWVVAGMSLAFTAVLGLAPGARAPNRFGPAPGAPSPLLTAEAFR